MSYRIYTYRDPYSIAKTDFWDEIKGYPQFCASRTLVNGLVSVMGDELETLICPLDAIVEDQLFHDWTSDISLRIQQYSFLSSEYKKQLDEGNISREFFDAITHNKNDMLDALRLFVELGINSSSVNPECGNREHRLFSYLLKVIENRPDNLFSVPAVPDVSTLADIIKKQATKEKEEFFEKKGIDPNANNTAYVQKREQMYDRMIDHSNKWDGKHIVIHGIHQFTPIQLRFITAINKMGVDIIFLYNYIPEYKEIYSSWDYIYQHFNAPIHHDSNVKKYVTPGQLQTQGNALACNIGLICSDNVERTDLRIKSNYDLYKDIEIEMFDNVSEYAGYVSDKFGKAERDVADGERLSDQPFVHHDGTAEVLAKMDEAIYTANKDVDELLQIYHPEYARTRHFLAYPIGQFFAALYDLWSWKDGEIHIDYNKIKACVNSGVLTKYNSEELLKTSLNLQVMFDNIVSFKDFVSRMTSYIDAYNRVHSSRPGMMEYDLRTMEIYNEYKVTNEDAENLLMAVTDINNIAVNLFKQDSSDQEHIHFKKHFKNLEKVLRKRETLIENQEEKELITHLLEKLEDIKPTTEAMDGTFEDLRSGIYFFLKQKENPDSNWFVKNFEQIDGDVLKSREQNKPGSDKVYHFACVSDKDMNCSRDELLPWPLTELFIERAYTPKDLQFQVYYSALGERSNFLRYALFYGLYFNSCKSKISFVRRYGDEVTEIYNLLKIIGLNPEQCKTSGRKEDEAYIVTSGATAKIDAFPYDMKQASDMYLCPYRYYFDYVLNPEPIESGAFLYQRLLQNIIIGEVWKKIEGNPVDVARKKIPSLIKQSINFAKADFCFMRESEFADIERFLNNYFSFNERIVPANGIVSRCNSDYIKLREIFVVLKYEIEHDSKIDRHAIDAFEKRVVEENGKRVLSIIKQIPEKPDSELIAGMMKYVNEAKENYERTGEWCKYCPNRDVCIKGYMVE